MDFFVEKKVTCPTVLLGGFPEKLCTEIPPGTYSSIFIFYSIIVAGIYIVDVEYYISKKLNHCKPVNIGGLRSDKDNNKGNDQGRT